MSEYKCSKCDYKSKTKWNVKNHIDRVCKGATLEENIIKVDCVICGKMFDTIKLLEQHKERCFEKRTITVSKFLDPEKTEETMAIIMTLISDLQNDNKELIKANKELAKEVNVLTKRIEILEEHKSKNGAEPIKNDPDVGEAMCEYSKKITFKPTSRRNFEEMYDMCNQEIDFSTTVILNGEVIERDADVDDEYLTVDGQRYYFDKKNVTRPDIMHAGKLKVVIFERCKCSATSKTKKGCFCDEHTL